MCVDRKKFFFSGGGGGGGGGGGVEKTGRMLDFVLKLKKTEEKEKKTHGAETIIMYKKNSWKCFIRMCP